MNATPRVTIVMAVYNAAPFVEQTITTALAQTMDDFEYLIVDDASSDDTVGVVSGVGDERIRLIRHQENRGPSAARNAAIRQARGELIALLDHDDLWEEKRLEALVGHLDGDERTGMASSNMYVGDPARPDEARTILANPDCAGLSIPDPHAWARGCGFSASTAVVRRRLFESHGAYDESLLYCQDWELMLRFWIAGELAAMLPEPMGWTVIRPGQLSANIWGMFEERLSVLRAALGKPGLPDGFCDAVRDEIRNLETDGARVVLGEALAAGSENPGRLRRDAIWAARYHLRGMERLKAVAAAVSPRTVAVLRRKPGESPSVAPSKQARGLFEKPRDEFPSHDR